MGHCWRQSTVVLPLRRVESKQPWHAMASPHRTRRKKQMSIMRCEKHGHWDSDFDEGCPRCEQGSMTPEYLFECICDELNVQMDPRLYDAVRVFAERLQTVETR